MHSGVRGVLFVFAFVYVSAFVKAQQSSISSPPKRDQQAISILSQCLQAAGGTQVISNIQDFTGSGTITYGDQTQGSVTIKGRGLTQFRVDANLPDGVHSWIVSKGLAFQRIPDGSTSPLPSQNAVKSAIATFPLPYLFSVLQDTSISISYGGLVTHDGAQVYDILVQKTLTPSTDPLNTVGDATKAHFFIDPKALVIVSVQDSAFRKDGGPGASAHEMQFSNYQNVSGLSVPFSISEFIAGQKTSTIQLTQLTFNSDLTDADFD